VFKIILDVGCGSGHYQTESGKNRDRGTVNLDILKPVYPIKNFVLGDANNLPFKNNAFKKTYFLDVIEHVNNPYNVLKEIKRVTFGTVMLGTPNAYYFVKILRILTKGSYKVYESHIFGFGIVELKKLVNSAGFKIVKTKIMTYDINPKLIWRILDKIVPASFKRNILLVLK
jgi:ubiquinone/menaquinone biosynthesis C-methylase UbiE